MTSINDILLKRMKEEIANYSYVCSLQGVFDLAFEEWKLFCERELYNFNDIEEHFEPEFAKKINKYKDLEFNYSSIASILLDYNLHGYITIYADIELSELALQTHGYDNMALMHILYDELLYVEKNNHVNEHCDLLFNIYAIRDVVSEIMWDFLLYLYGLNDTQEMETGRIIPIKKDQLINEEISRLKKEIEGLKRENKKLKGSNGTKRTENKQAEIIAVLAMLYTKKDGTAPYEMAETILQEWQRRAGEIGNPPDKNTLAKYIKQGKEIIDK